MKKSNPALADHLNQEADRYTALAKDLALQVLRNPLIEAAQKRRKAEDHLLRAETYRHCASLAGG